MVVLKFEHALPHTSHPSRPSINVLENMTRVSMEVTSKDYRTSMGKVCIAPHCPFFTLFFMFDQAIDRDSFRCTITGV